MSFVEALPVRYHQQDDTFTCGPACSQMILEKLGAGVFLQSDLETQKLPPYEPGWATAPNQLPPLLNDNCPATLPGSYALFETNSKDALARKIVWSIFHYKKPIIALVYGGGHWLVVNGFESDAQPTSPTDTTYSILAFQLQNPKRVPAAPPPPHAGVDTCGTGGVYGLANEHLPYLEWDYSYAVPVTIPSLWNGKLLAICDTDPPPTIIGAQAKRLRQSRGDQIISPDEARKQAWDALRRNRLEDFGGWKDSLAGTSPGKPILVQRLDRRDDYYYMVPMEKEHAIPVVICIDGRFGNYRQAARTLRSTDNAFQNLSFDGQAALQLALSKPIDLGKSGKLRLREESCVLYPTLVWRPCRESMSPYVPFFMIISGKYRVYVRVDGQVFAKLHTRDLGN